jgi:SNF2 family DNA or RNA helicase
VTKFEPTPVLLDSEVSDDNCDETPSELRSLVKQIQANRERETSSRIDFHNSLNRRRCFSSPFPYSLQLLKCLEIEVGVFDRQEAAELRGRQVIETPLELLELRRSQMARASDADIMIEKFVFCVPPAGTRAPILDNGMPNMQESGLSKDSETMIQEPLENLFRPFSKAAARLSSFFPDKKLVQYDAGKLQTLAQLLRQLKQGGHRALIFTQMSKMLDILEAFLNINGHTYLRLDGATGVDRRQRYMDRFNNDEKIFCFILSTRSGGMGINLTGADTGAIITDAFDYLFHTLTIFY